jgi:hypothetical protein
LTIPDGDLARRGYSESQGPAGCAELRPRGLLDAARFWRDWADPRLTAHVQCSDSRDLGCRIAPSKLPVREMAYRPMPSLAAARRVQAAQPEAHHDGSRPSRFANSRYY